MKKPCENPENEILEKLIGLGSSSIQKSYYPELQKKIDELENERKKYKSFFDNAFNGILRLNEKGEIFEANPAILHMTNFDQISDLKGKNFKTELMSYPDEWEQILKDIKDKKPIKNFFIKLKTAKNKEILISANILKSEQKQDLIEIFCENISDKKKMEEELAHRQKMDALGQLAAGIAHDFNNILTGILGSCELVYPHVEDKYKKFIDTTVELLERSIDKKIIISKDFQASNFQISGDESLIQNAFLNLGINAKDAMPKGGIIFFRTKNKTLDENTIKYLPYEINPGNYLEIEVQDSGDGIPFNILSKIFDPFFTTKENGKGSGLGLSSVYGTIKKHNGIITVYSEPEKGSLFKILLPLSDSKDLEQNLELVKFVKGKGTILIADDEEAIRLTSSALIETFGYNVETAENGFEALKIYKKNPVKFDLVILDMIMPLMDGEETFFEIKKINPEAKIIISSGFSKDSTIKILKEKGLKGFIKKPFQKSELSSILFSSLQ
ncbi:MAG: response regulator [Desulforegulaceae bacterium]|nr:response regulator [Desulforegulaceae bacterium]